MMMFHTMNNTTNSKLFIIITLCIVLLSDHLYIVNSQSTNDERLKHELKRARKRRIRPEERTFSSVRNSNFEHSERLYQYVYCGFIPSFTLDVGAANGEWSNTMQQIIPDSDFFMVEANPHQKDSLASRNIPFQIALVSDKNENITMYMSDNKKSAGNSMFQENSNHKFEPTVMPAYSIDHIIQTNNLPTIKLLKLDVQGAELKALRGALSALSNIEVIFLEVQVHNFNHGAPGLLPISLFLNQLDFELYDVFGLNHIDRVGRNKNVKMPNGGAFRFLIQMDVVFVKKSSLLWNEECSGMPRMF